MVPHIFIPYIFASLVTLSAYFFASLVTLSAYFFTRYLFSRLIRPAAFIDEKNKEEEFILSAPDERSRFNLIFLGGNGYTSAAGQYIRTNQQLFEIGHATQSIYKDFEYKRDGATYYHPSYATNADALSNQVVNYAITAYEKNPERKIIIAGISLGGGIAAQTVLKLKHRGIDADFIGVRTFPSIGAAAASIFGVKSERLSKFLANTLNIILNFFGSWDLNTQKAITRIQQIDRENLEKKAGRQSSNIVIAGHSHDSLLGFHGSLVNTYQSGDRIKVFSRRDESCSRNHNTEVPESVFAPSVSWEL